ncbi:unnamed protein product [Chironomus riparius]|uniref:Uncharacterized protein n=1 Tax=Chironomus riparius TaxID=315576 RepID=A0A9N9RUB2_9DIPT|nr:unnamed protein product [Chironomus riparius]
MRISTTIILLSIAMCYICIVESAPTPSPAFPFTVLPKPGHGHRKIAGRKGPARLDFLSFMMYKSLLIDKKHSYIQPHDHEHHV